MATCWLDRTISVKKIGCGHKVYVNGQEVEDVRRISFTLDGDAVPTAVLEIAAPKIDIEYDDGVYKRT